MYNQIYIGHSLYKEKIYIYIYILDILIVAEVTVLYGCYSVNKWWFLEVSSIWVLRFVIMIFKSSRLDRKIMQQYPGIVHLQIYYGYTCISIYLNYVMLNLKIVQFLNWNHFKLLYTMKNCHSSHSACPCVSGIHDDTLTQSRGYCGLYAHSYVVTDQLLTGSIFHPYGFLWNLLKGV